MMYFCADDYGVSQKSNLRILECVENGALNKVSVLVNGVGFEDAPKKVSAELSLHLNLVEGFPLSKREDVELLVDKDGAFRYSFMGLFARSLFGGREFEGQVYNEVRSQLKRWRELVGDVPILVDSHQHTHMIPVVMRALMQAVRDEGVRVKYLRIPREPVMAYLRTPSLYFSYSIVNFVKQTLLNFLAFVNKREYKGIETAYCMGILFSGKMDELRVKKLLKKYPENVELVFHPGFLDKGDEMLKGARAGFEKFYFSRGRKIEYHTLLNFYKQKEG